MPTVPGTGARAAWSPEPDFPGPGSAAPASTVNFADVLQRQEFSSVSATEPEGIINPPIDELLDAAGSKYSLVIYAAKRARQINAYYSQLSEGLLEYVGPLVDTHVHEKPLSIALREINAGLLTAEPIEAPANQ
jgi:DNA-directed RNA polymerase subunit omega